MAKGKMKSSKAGFGVKAGGKKMFGEQGAKPSKPGRITQSQPGHNSGFKANGGSGKMFGFTGSKAASPR